MMQLKSTWVFLLLCFTGPSWARDWVDASGHYQFKGELVARNETLVVLEKGNKDLVAVDIDQLSEKDQQYLADLAEKTAQNPDLQTWTTRKGLSFRAAAVEYVRRDVVIRRVRGKAYVNDHQFRKLPGIYRKIIPNVVSHFEKVPLDEKTFEKWVKDLRGNKKTYTCDGVLLELENGDLYAVPFFLFSNEDLERLRPGWDEWVQATDDEASREHYSMSMQAQARANQQEQAERRTVAKLQLQLQGYQAGLFDLWEVALFPPPNVRGVPMTVVVPGRNSAQAQAAALSTYPGYRVGPVRKASRRY